MEQSELLRFFIGTLEQLRLRYFVTSSVATIFFGEPRFTNDIDVVVDLPANRIADFCQAFPGSDFYVREESVRGAVARKSQGAGPRRRRSLRWMSGRLKSNGRSP